MFHNDKFIPNVKVLAQFTSLSPRSSILLSLSSSLSLHPCVYFSPGRNLPRVLNLCVQTYIDPKMKNT